VGVHPRSRSSRRFFYGFTLRENPAEPFCWAGTFDVLLDKLQHYQPLRSDDHAGVEDIHVVGIERARRASTSIRSAPPNPPK
jgi:hypothetical protein